MTATLKNEFIKTSRQVYALRKHRERMALKRKIVRRGRKAQEYLIG